MISRHSCLQAQARVRDNHSSRWRRLCSAASLLFCLALGMPLSFAAESAVDFDYAPGLESVPAPLAPGDKLPLPATWPALRHERRLRFLGIISLQYSYAAASLQRIARRCNASLDFVFTVDDRGPTPDDITTLAHTNDQWIEAKDNPSVAEVAEKAAQVRRETLAAASGLYDVVFSWRAYEELAAYVEKGGIWAVCGNVMPAENSPLLAHWPAKPSAKNSWHQGGAQRGEAAEVLGLPLARLSSHQWHGIYEPTEGSIALATGEAGAAFLRRIKKGTILLVPTGPISRTWDAVARMHRAYDHDEIWLRFWDQVLHGLISGEKALPIMADLSPGEGEATPAKEYLLPGKIVNRTTLKQKAAVSAHAVSAQGKVVYAGETQEVELAPGESRDWAVKIPIGEDWPAGIYTAYLTVGDAVAKRQSHQACELFAVSGAVKMALASQKPGYRLGENAAFAVTASATSPWQGEIRWAIHDFRGRLLGCGVMPCELGPEAKNFAFSWHFADHGVRVDTVWATAAAVKDGKEWARAEVRAYKHERWNMRNEYQWSVWSSIACQAPCLVPQTMRLLAHAGFNAFGYPGRNELYYPAERWSWRIYNEGVGTNTFSPLIESVTDEEIEEAVRKTFHKPSGDLTTGALVLASVGEEAGFKDGWGKTYYWDTPIAPEKACQAFQRFLKEKYPSLETLNAAWGTKYKTWEEVKLTREFSGRPPEMGKDGWAHPKESPLGAGAPGVTLAPFMDAQKFYHWYYDKVIA
ncbi:MAG: beta-galactosidase, partial [Planctomycetota bacterium]|nr:beta-galactosidase [Planctomycetota bacterium]